MTEPEIIVERKKYGSSAMDYTMRVYQKLDEETKCSGRKVNLSQ